MSFGRRMQAAAPDQTYRSQPPHIRRLIDAMQAIFDDASSVADAIRQKRPLAVAATDAGERHLSPIRCKESEKLFEHRNEAGETQYTTYGFTQDFNLNLITAEAQFKLLDLYTRVIFVNASIHQGAAGKGVVQSAALWPLTGDIDEILVKSSYFVCLFRTYAISAEIIREVAIGHQPRVELEKMMHQHLGEWVERMNETIERMFRPDRVQEFAPQPRPRFLIAASGPYHEGQRVINGVYFPQREATIVMEKLGRTQAPAVSARMSAG